MIRRLAPAVLVIAFAAFLLTLMITMPMLPLRMATHFDIAGRPDGWMSRTQHLIFMTGFGIGFPAIILGCCWSARYLPNSAINLPHKDYWLSSERRDASVDFLFHYSFWLAALGQVFITGLQIVVVAGNRQQPVQLPLIAMAAVTGTFLLGTLLWVAGLYRHFHRPDSDSKIPSRPPQDRDPHQPSVRLGLMLAGILCGTTVATAAESGDSPGDLPLIADVEGQPLASNAVRLMEALEALGSPASDSLRSALKTAIDERDAARIQQLLDPLVLLTLSINPESRVRVARGPARAVLQQWGFTPFLIKVLNDSTVTRRLRPLSPQSGAVYAGVTRGSMLRQQSTELIENENRERSRERFLDLAVYDQPPMRNRLSGLAAEYVILLVLATESGQREARIGFDLDDNEQDLGARGETPVLFSIRPAIPVRLAIREQDGTPTLAALLIRDRHGRVYPPQPKRLAPDFFFQPQIYRADGETVLLPPGTFQVQSGRGPEYWVRSGTLTVHPDGSAGYQPERHEPDPGRAPPSDAASSTPQIRVDRWVDPRQFGFYSGDHHIHAAGCAHYTSPTEGVLPEDMFRQVKGEGLNVGCVLTWGPCYRYQRQFFASRPHDVSEPLTLLKYDLEISGFGSQALGHVCLLNLSDQTYPGSNGTETEGWPKWTTPVLRWARSQGGVTGYAHSASGLAIDPDAAAQRLLTRCDGDSNGLLTSQDVAAVLLPEPFPKIDSDGDGALTLRELVESHRRVADRLPNLAIPEMNGVGAMEICVATAEGVCDFISAMDTRRIQEWNTWYHLLNCGFPLKVSGETDFPCMSSRRVGQGRVYVQLDPADRPGPQGPPLNFGRWCEGLAKGRSYVSDGFAHALEFHVAGVAPGWGDVRLENPGRVRVTATVVFAPQTPQTVAQGTLTPAAGRQLVGDTVELHGPRTDRLIAGGERQVELIVNGLPVAVRKVAADGQRHTLEFEIDVARSSWVALRQFPQLHTNPVNVLVADAPIRASRDSARWCDDVIALLWKNRHQTIPAGERDEARGTFERAQAAFRRIAAESP